jgi:predicted site-specific integrase-resolvase
MNDYDPERDGELLPARDVCSLLHIARSTLPLWRARGDLIAYKGRNSHWRYPSNQPTLVEARQALQGGNR